MTRSTARQFFGSLPATAAAADRPYPAPQPGTPRAAEALKRTLDKGRLAGVIPPESRIVVGGCSEQCRTCRGFTRNNGSCPGMAPSNRTARLLCHVDEAGRMADPVELDERLEPRLIAGQERFWLLDGTGKPYELVRVSAIGGGQ